MPTEMREVERSPIKGIRKHFQIGGGIHTGFAVLIMDVIHSLDPNLDAMEVAIMTIEYLKQEED
jgi:hypothetical protein